jgi:hypothetical protein
MTAPDEQASPFIPLLAAFEGLTAATDAATFHRHLAVLISHAKLLPDDWLEEIAKQAAQPWKRGKGRPALERRQDEIEWQYCGRYLGGLRPGMPRRVDAVADIVRAQRDLGKTITEVTAGKMYDAAARSYAKKPYAGWRLAAWLREING